MKLLTLGVLGYAIKNYLGNFKNSIIDSVGSEMERTKSEIDTNTKKNVSAGTTSAVEQVTKAVNNSVQSATRDAEARAHGYSSYDEWIRMADAK